MKPFALILSLAASASSTFAQDYFPLHVGNQWIYATTTFGRTTFLSIDIPRTETAGDRTYAVVRGFEEGPALLRGGDDSTLYRYNAESGREEVWAAFATKEGDSYETAINPCTRRAVVESRSGKASVPAGEFTNTFSVRYPAANCADAGLTNDAFAPYIGLVERTSTTIAGPRRMQLIYARVGGVTVLSQPEVAFTLTLDQSVYEVGKAATARLTLRNSSPRPLILDFSSSQRYDIVIRDDSGKEVFRSSAARTYLQVLGREEIAQGERNYIELVTLAGLDGQPLPAGRYTMEAWIAPAPGSQRPRFAATVGFEIR